MKLYFAFYALTLSTLSIAQIKTTIVTSDIDNFWEAYDALEEANTNADSIHIIQTRYIDKASKEFEEFIRIRNFTSEEFVKKIGKYPKFWNDIRKHTLRIKDQANEIDEALTILAQEIPSFENPKVCFAIGCLRTGGTVSGKLILIGTEIASADQSVDKSELSDWLQSVIGNTGDITSMVAHEAIHTRQIKKGKYNLLNASIAEGSADFLTTIILNKNINLSIHEYGKNNECELKKEFFSNLRDDPSDYSQWLFNGTRAKNKPADMGYFIGYRISEAYYNAHPDKQEAISNLLDRRKYKHVLKNSGYELAPCK